MSQEHKCRVCPVYGQEPVHWEYPEVCEPCRKRMRRHLADITDQWLLLDATPGGGNTEKVTGSKEAPLGARVDVLDQMLPAGADDAIRANISPGEAMVPGPNGPLHIRGAYGEQPAQITEIDMDDPEEDE